MKHFLLYLIVGLSLYDPSFALAQTTSAPPQENEPLTYEELVEYITNNKEDLNASIPSYLQPVIGNKAVQFVVSTKNGNEYIWIEAEDGVITKVQSGKHADPALRVSTDIKTINRLTNTIEDESLGAGVIKEAIDAGDIVIEFLIIDNIIENTLALIEENEGATQGTLAAAVPIIAVANPGILAYVPHLRALFAHFLNWLLSLFGIRKKRQPWATIYDAITKQPQSLAVVRLYRLDDDLQPHLAETQVTDKEGRFGFLPQTGKHRLEIVKPQFVYPSTLVSTAPDNTFETIYRGETLNDKTTEKIIGAGIPLDPINPSDTKAAGSPTFRLLKGVLALVSRLLLIVGLLVSVGMVMYNVTAVNIAIALLYLIVLSLHWKLKPTKTHPWGVVYQSSDLSPVPLASVSILDTKFNKILQTHLSDYKGRFAFFPPPGEYKLMVQKSGFHFPSIQKEFTKKTYKKYYGETFTVKKQNQTTPIDIPIDSTTK